MKFRVGQKVNYKGNFNLKNPCTIMSYDQRLKLYKVIDSVGDRWSAEDRVFVPIPVKYYFNTDIYDLLLRVYNQTPEQVFEELNVKRIWTDGNTVNCTDTDGDDKELNTDDLVQYLCRMVDE